MGDSYYCRYPGDYQRDTRHLSLMEHGAYCLLLDAYYSTGRPLPASVEALVRIVGAQGKAEREAVERVVCEFFPVNGDGLRHNPRADRELTRRAVFLADQARKAKLGADARWNARGDARGQGSGTVRGCPDLCPDDAPPSPSPSPSPKPAPTPTPSPSGKRAIARSCAPPAEFLDFWEAYPKPTGKGAALKSWTKNVRNGDAAAIMKALRWQVRSRQWTEKGGRFIPMPATYLNQRRWEDRPQAEVGPAGVPLSELGEAGQRQAVIAQEWLEDHKRKEASGA